MQPPIISKTSQIGVILHITIYIEGKIFWRDDTVRTDVFYSPNICGKYVEVVK